MRIATVQRLAGAAFIVAVIALAGVARGAMGEATASSNLLDSPRAEMSAR